MTAEEWKKVETALNSSANKTPLVKQGELKKE